MQHTRGQAPRASLPLTCGGTCDQSPCVLMALCKIAHGDSPCAQADGSLHPHLKHIDIGDGFDIISYATAVGNELLWALEGLIEKLHKKKV